MSDSNSSSVTTNITDITGMTVGVLNGKIGSGATSTGTAPTPTAPSGPPQNLGAGGRVFPEFTGNIGSGGQIIGEPSGGGSAAPSAWRDAPGGATTPPSRWSGGGSAETAEYGDLAAVRRFAAEVNALGDGSDFVQIIRACHSLADAIRDFGGDMNASVREFVDAAITVAAAGDALRDQAAQVAHLANDLSGEN